MAEVVQGLGLGGQTLAARAVGWHRRTIRQGRQALRSGQPIVDGYERSGRQRIALKLPHLLAALRALVDPQTQPDPSFQSTRLASRISAAAVRRQRLAPKGYQEEQLPSTETIRCRLNAMG